jgi:hypothetical protein
MGHIKQSARNKRQQHAASRASMRSRPLVNMLPDERITPDDVRWALRKRKVHYGRNVTPLQTNHCAAWIFPILRLAAQSSTPPVPRNRSDLRTRTSIFRCWVPSHFITSRYASLP